MKIKYFTNTNPYADSTASGNRIICLLDGLKSEGLLVQVFVCGGVTTMKNRAAYSNTGVEIIYFSNIVLDSLYKRRFHKYIGKYLIRPIVKRKVNSELFDFIGIAWVDSGNDFLWRIIASKKNRSYKLITEMNEYLDIHLMNKGNLFQKFEGERRRRFFENYFFHRIDGFALMTRTLIEHYNGFPAPQPRMLHLPMTVDIERFNQLAPSLTEFQKPYIAFVGVMNDAKDGVSNLIKAFNLIKEHFLEHKVYLVGAWNYDTPIHLDLIKSFGLEDRVFWMKEYSRDAIPSIIGNADLLALPRPDSKQAQGGFPTKLGEYLATGKPVCATTVGELPDYLIDNESVFFAQPGSVESFADAMRRALSEPENARRVGLNGKKVAQKEFNKDIQAKKLHQFLLELQDEKK